VVLSLTILEVSFRAVFRVSPACGGGNTNKTKNRIKVKDLNAILATENKTLCSGPQSKPNIRLYPLTVQFCHQKHTAS